MTTRGRLLDVDHVGPLPLTPSLEEQWDFGQIRSGIRHCEINWFSYPRVHEIGQSQIVLGEFLNLLHEPWFVSRSWKLLRQVWKSAGPRSEIPTEAQN